jgi:hypothetical protein
VKNKLMCLVLASAALALFPASSPASPVLTQPAGTALAVGTKVQGTRIGEVAITSGAGSILCTVWNTTGTVQTNTGTSFSVNVQSATFGGSAAEGACTSSLGGIKVTTAVAGGLPWCIASTKTADQFELRGGSCTEASRGIRIVLENTSIGECSYKRGTPMLGTFRTQIESDATMFLGEQEFTKEAGNLFCPATLKLDYGSTWEKDGTFEALTIS